MNAVEYTSTYLTGRIWYLPFVFILTSVFSSPYWRTYYDISRCKMVVPDKTRINCELFYFIRFQLKLLDYCSLPESSTKDQSSVGIMMCCYYGYHSFWAEVQDSSVTNITTPRVLWSVLIHQQGQDKARWNGRSLVSFVIERYRDSMAR